MSLTKNDLKQIQEIIEQSISTSINSSENRIKKALRKELSASKKRMINFMVDTFPTKREVEENYVSKEDISELKELTYNLSDMVIGIKRFLETTHVVLKNMVFEDREKIEALQGHV